MAIGVRIIIESQLRIQYKLHVILFEVGYFQLERSVTVRRLTLLIATTSRLPTSNKAQVATAGSLALLVSWGRSGVRVGYPGRRSELGENRETPLWLQHR